MHFTCDSCRATLQIADEKVKGKRLVVRCKRCGAKINISDPALAAGGAARAASSSPASAPPAAGKPASSAGSALEHQRIDPSAGEKGDSDTESTRAMETSVLEEALRASQALGEDAAKGGKPAAAKPPPPAPAAGPRDPSIWFAMVGGKQVGPVSRAELGLKTAQGAVGPRTYVWKEGMGAWQRAKEVGELSSLFAEPPGQPSAPPPPVALPPPTRSSVAVPTSQSAANGGKAPSGAFREFSTQDFGALDLEAAAAAEKKQGGDRAAREFSTQDFGSSPLAGMSLDDVVDDGKPISAKAGAGGKAAAPAASKPAPAAAKPAPTAIKVNQHPQARPEPELQPLDISIEGYTPLKVDEGGDSTNVDSMPLGERVHQDKVAKELFTTGQDSSGASAIDLARWASEELASKAASPKTAAASASALDSTSAPGAEPLTGDRAGPLSAPAEVQKPAARPRETALQFGHPAGRGEGRRTALFVVVGLAAAAVIVYFLFANNASEPAGQPVKADVATTGPATPGADSGSAAGATGKDSGAKPPVNTKPATPGGTANQPDQRPAGTAPAAPAGDKAAADKIAADKAAADKIASDKAAADKTAANTSKDAAAGTPSPAGLSREVFDKVVSESQPTYKPCVDEALRRNSKLRVKVTISIKIAPTGKVLEAGIDRKDAAESALGQCLLRTTRKIVFPAFTGEPTPGVIPLLIAAGE